MPHRLAAPLGLALTAAHPAAAGPMNGTWSISAEACVAEFTDARITITDEAIEFHEAWCRFANERPVPGLPLAWVYDLNCEGEGSTWSETMVLALVRDGTALVQLTEYGASEVMRCK